MNPPISVFYAELQKDLANKSGLVVDSFHNCQRLSGLMSEAGFLISTHTLARFFGLLPQRRMYPSTVNLLCSFLGHEDFGAYKKAKSLEMNESLLRKDDLFKDPEFSVQGFELVLRLLDEDGIRSYLASMCFPHSGFSNVAQLVGSLVRASTNRDRLLGILSSHRIGRALFFESFVDEDDPDGYFSKAIEQYYLHGIDSPAGRLFAYSFLICRAVYANLKPEDSWVHGFRHECAFNNEFPWFFHQISRRIETDVLLAWLSGDLSKPKLYGILDSCVAEVHRHDNHAATWILARALKALAKSGSLQTALKHPPFAGVLKGTYLNGQMDSIGALILQFVNHCFYRNEVELFSPPLLLSSKGFINESYTRLSVESATRLIYASDSERKHLSPSFTTFSKNHGTDWLLTPLSMIKNKSK